MVRHARRLKVKPGAAPGTLRIDPQAPKPTIRVMGYGPDGFVEETVERPQELESYLGRWPVTWVNVNGLGDETTLRALARLFGLHRLALEDAANLGQRAKVEPFDEQLFVVMRMADPVQPRLLEQISLFLGKNYVLTFQERAGDCFDPVRQRIRDGKGKLRQVGPDYLVYALADAVIDGYFPVLEAIGDRLDELEQVVFGAPEETTVNRIQEIKGHLRELRQHAWPHRDVASALMREEAFIDERTKLYLRDCEDHAIHVIDRIDNYREVAADLMNAYLSSVSNRMNEVMKVLTIVAAVFIPLSFIAGLYGMNFDPEVSPWNMPELGWAFGYPAALLLMAVVAGGMVWYFVKKKWLG
jgi:magnesium transporter